VTSAARLAVVESRLARGGAEVLAATAAAAFDPTLAAGEVGAALFLVEEAVPLPIATAEDGLPLAGPLLPGVARALLPLVGGPGDVAAAADPDLGLATGEVAMVRGAYLRGRLVGAVASLALHDGLRPGFVAVPHRLARSGEADPTLLGLLAANAARPATLRGDLLAQAAGLAPAVAVLERLAAEGDLREAGRRLAAAAEGAARGALRGRPADEPPAGSEAAATVAEPDDLPPPRLRVTLVPDGAGGLRLDFAGSDLYRPGLPALAPARAAALARFAVAGAVPEAPLNAGLLAAVDVRLPEGSVLAPALPRGARDPGDGADRGLPQRLVALVHRALARLAPARALAGDGDGGVLVVEMPDAPGRPGWRCRLPLGGGGGASAGADGLANIPSVTSIAPAPSVEALESAYPVRVLRYRLREGEPGPGRYRGGPGVELEVEVPDAARAEWSGPGGVRPTGLLGGGSGAPGGSTAHGRRVTVRTGSGGGYGNPYERAIRLVVADVAAGLVDAEEARRAYGVAVTPDGGVDDHRTYRIRNFVFTTLSLDEL
jgi:N-methylhydantoinase B